MGQGAVHGEYRRELYQMGISVACPETMLIDANGQGIVMSGNERAQIERDIRTSLEACINSSRFFVFIADLGAATKNAVDRIRISVVRKCMSCASCLSDAYQHDVILAIGQQ